MEHKKRNDIILIGLILIVGVISLIGIEWYKSITTHEGYAVIFVNGEETERYSLEEEITIRIEGEDGAYNVLRIQDGTACIEEASCPDKLCVKQGTIDKNGETVVCLPNQVVIEIISDEEAEVDISTN